MLVKHANSYLSITSYGRFLSFDMFFNPHMHLKSKQTVYKLNHNEEIWSGTPKRKCLKLNHVALITVIWVEHFCIITSSSLLISILICIWLLFIHLKDFFLPFCSQPTRSLSSCILSRHSLSGQFPKSRIESLVNPVNNSSIKRTRIPKLM